MRTCVASSLWERMFRLPLKCASIKLAMVLLEHILLYLDTPAVVPTRVLLAAHPPQQAGAYQLVGT